MESRKSTGEPIFKAEIETVDVEKKYMETKAEGGMGWTGCLGLMYIDTTMYKIDN